jgi:regulator of nucleoside diphosphate kinase
MKVNMADFANLSLISRGSPLQRKLESALAVPSDEVPPDVVTMQSRVLLRDEASGERSLVCVVYPSEADSTAGRISVLDALGVELFGASVGDTIECGSIQGTRRLRIEEIVYQPELSMRTNIIVRE